MQAGDILFYRGGSGLSDGLIRCWTRGPFAHVEVAVDELQSIGALTNGVELHVARPPDAVYSPVGVTAENLLTALRWLYAQLGDPYSYADIVDDVYHVFWNRAPLLVQPRAYDCSDLASHFLLAAHTGVTVNKKQFLQPETISPNDLARLVGVLK